MLQPLAALPCGGATSPTGATGPTGVTGHRDLPQRPQMSTFKPCCACAVPRRTKSTQRCRSWCCGGCPRHGCGGMDRLWCDSQPGSSCPGSPRGNGWCCESLERAELLWLRARPGWCVRGIFHQLSCSRCSEQLESWGVAVTFSGKVVKRSVRSVAVGRAGM